MIADHARGLLHVMRWPDELVALEPATGDVAFRFAEGLAPLAVVGNRLVALGEQRLWILDTHDGAAVFELALPFVPSLDDAGYRPSSVEITEHAGNAVVVSMHLERKPDHDPQAYAALQDRAAALKQARADYEAARARAKAEAKDYAFAVDVETGRVVPVPPAEARETVGYDLRLAGVRVRFSGSSSARVTGGSSEWRLGTRALFAEPPRAAPPPPPFPQPWPKPVALGNEQPFAPGPSWGRVGWSAVADPLRGVYHLLLEDALVAIDPETGKRVYTHAEPGSPLAVVGNRLVVRGDGALWILDTQDGAAVYRLTAEQLPPLRDTADLKGSVAATDAQGSLLRLETWSSERPPAAPDAVERQPWSTTRYALGLDVATGELREPPERKRQEPGLQPAPAVGRFRLDTWNDVARGRRRHDHREPPLWELRMRDLRYHAPLKVEADDPPR